VRRYATRWRGIALASGKLGGALALHPLSQMRNTQKSFPRHSATAHLGGNSRFSCTFQLESCASSGQNAMPIRAIPLEGRR